MPDDAPVVERSVDVDAFAEFYGQQYVSTVRLVAFLSGGRGAAEDLAQEAFLRLQPVFSGLEHPAAYLRTTVVNLCRNHYRSASRESRRLIRYGAPPTSVSERAAELDATLRRLPYDERAVVVLRYWLGLSEAEIAAHLNCRPGTVKSRHARALTKIRKELS